MSTPKNCPHCESDHAEDWADNFAKECMSYLHGCFMAGGKIDNQHVAAMARCYAPKPATRENTTADDLATVLDLIVRDGQGSVFLLNQAHRMLIKYREGL